MYRRLDTEYFVVMQLRCPICKTDILWEGNPYRPFCSERCRLVDLGAWTDDRYRIAGDENDDEQPGEGVPEED